MNIEDRMKLVREVGEEIITEEELRTLFETKKHPVAYDGFEPSGKIHIAQGTLRVININKMIESGCKFKMWVADWYAWMNNKLDGDLEKIQITGKYMIEVWKACGMEVKNVEFIWSKDVMSNDEYWKMVVNIARNSTVKRITRCSQIMGRSQSEALTAAQIFYPCMQCSDIFYLKADITQLGIDQRKVNILARELGPKLGFWKPVVVSHHMLMGLGKPPSESDDFEERMLALKMSKSKPETAIFMDDSFEAIKRKIKNAYCPEKIVSENPIMEYCKYIIFEKFRTLKIERPAKFGGDLEITSHDELEKIFEKGELHPMDLKNAAAIRINELIEPVRKHFESGKAKELLEQVESFKVTR